MLTGYVISIRPALAQFLVLVFIEIKYIYPFIYEPIIIRTVYKNVLQCTWLKIPSYQVNFTSRFLQQNALFRALFFKIPWGNIPRRHDQHLKQLHQNHAVCSKLPFLPYLISKWIMKRNVYEKGYITRRTTNASFSKYQVNIFRFFRLIF